MYLFAFIFLNVIFYRISEYGTDRTGQIFIFFLLISFINILYKYENLELNLKFLTLLTVFLITTKSYFLTYFIFIIFAYCFIFISNKNKLNNFLYNKLNFFFNNHFISIFIKKFFK